MYQVRICVRVSCVNCVWRMFTEPDAIVLLLHSQLVCMPSCCGAVCESGWGGWEYKAETQIAKKKEVLTAPHFPCERERDRERETEGQKESKNL